VDTAFGFQTLLFHGWSNNKPVTIASYSHNLSSDYQMITSDDVDPKLFCPEKIILSQSYFAFWTSSGILVDWLNRIYVGQVMQVCFTEF
jgi:hypothetical protein